MSTKNISEMPFIEIFFCRYGILSFIYVYPEHSTLKFGDLEFKRNTHRDKLQSTLDLKIKQTL